MAEKAVELSDVAVKDKDGEVKKMTTFLLRRDHPPYEPKEMLNKRTSQHPELNKRGKSVDFRVLWNP